MFETCGECQTQFAVGIKACPHCSAPVTDPVNEQPLVWRGADGVPVETTTGLPPEPADADQRHAEFQAAIADTPKRIEEAAHQDAEKSAPTGGGKK